MVNTKQIKVSEHDHELLSEVAQNEGLKIGQIAHRAIVLYYDSYMEYQP